MSAAPASCVGAPPTILPTLAAYHAARRGEALHIVEWTQRDRSGQIAHRRMEFDTLALARECYRLHPGASLQTYPADALLAALREKGVLL